MSRPANLACLNDRQWEDLQNLASRYEKAWQHVNPQSGSVNLEEFLFPPDSSLRGVGLHELIKIDLEIRWRHHQPTCFEHYLRDFPELGSMGDLPDELIYEEYRVRQRYGDRPSLESYRSRFPTQFGRLERLVREGSVREPATPPPLPPTDSLLVKGAEVGHGYILERFRGAGQFAQVWEALAPGPVLCAVKILSSPNDSAQSKTERSALELIKGLPSPYLLRPWAFWEWRGRLVIATDLAAGSLRDRLKECVKNGLPGIPARELVRYMKNAAEGLDCLHAHGLIHRDIKPDNLLYNGQYALVADCGLARHQLDSQRSVQKSFAGTPAYMAGEAWGGTAKPASDLFGLAVTYAELRCGHPLYVAGSTDRWLFALGEPELSEFGDAEAKVIKRALHPKYKLRQKNCTEFALALERALQSQGKRSGFFTAVLRWLRLRSAPPPLAEGGATVHEVERTQYPPGALVQSTPTIEKPAAAPVAPKSSVDDLASLRANQLAPRDPPTIVPAPAPRPDPSGPAVQAPHVPAPGPAPGEDGSVDMPPAIVAEIQPPTVHNLAAPPPTVRSVKAPPPPPVTADVVEIQWPSCAGEVPVDPPGESILVPTLLRPPLPAKPSRRSRAWQQALPAAMIALLLVGLSGLIVWTMIKPGSETVSNAPTKPTDPIIPPRPGPGGEFIARIGKLIEDRQYPEAAELLSREGNELESGKKEEQQRKIEDAWLGWARREKNDGKWDVAIQDCWTLLRWFPDKDEAKQLVADILSEQIPGWIVAGVDSYHRVEVLVANIRVPTKLPEVKPGVSPEKEIVHLLDKGKEALDKEPPNPSEAETSFTAAEEKWDRWPDAKADLRSQARLGLARVAAARGNDWLAIPKHFEGVELPENRTERDCWIALKWLSEAAREGPEYRREPKSQKTLNTLNDLKSFAKNETYPREAAQFRKIAEGAIGFYAGELDNLPRRDARDIAEKLSNPRKLKDFLAAAQVEGVTYQFNAATALQECEDVTDEARIHKALSDRAQPLMKMPTFAMKSPKRAAELLQRVAELAENENHDYLDDAWSAIKDAPLSPELASYGAYVRALRYAKDEPRKTADELLQAFEEEKTLPVLEEKPERKKRVGHIFLNAARELRNGGTFDHPFAKEDKEEQNRNNAGRAYRWLEKSDALAAESKDLSLRINLALAVWYKDAPDRQAALDRSAALLTEDLKDDLAAVLLVHARSASEKPAKKKEALASYRKLVDQLAPRDKAPKATAFALVRAVLIPARKLAEELAEDQQYARFSAVQARLVADNPDRDNGPTEDRWQEVFKLYGAAVNKDKGNDPKETSRYLAGRGEARAHLAQPDKDILADAEAAIEKDHDNPDGHALKGFVLLEQSRRMLDYGERLKGLENAKESYTIALTAARGTRPGMLVNASQFYLELGNFVTDPVKRKLYLIEAEQNADAATQSDWRDRDRAWAALGNAREDRAWLLGETEKYEKAATAFGNAHKLRPEPRYLIDRGRVQYRWAKYGGGPEKDCLANADAELRAALDALDRKPDPVAQAKAHDWLGLVALQQNKEDEARAQFKKAADLVDPASVDSRNYALDWMTLIEQEAGRKLPAILADAVRQRAKKVELAADPEIKLKAGLHIGKSYELEDKPKEARDQYTSLLPRPPADYKASHLRVILARGNLYLNDNFATRLEPDYKALTDEADRAVKLAGGDRLAKSFKGQVFGYAGKVWRQWGAQIETAERAPRWTKSIDYYREALLLAPGDADSVVWRLDMVDNTTWFLRNRKKLPQDSPDRWDDKTAEKRHQEAQSLLNEAKAAKRTEYKDVIGELQTDLDNLKKK